MIRQFVYLVAISLILYCWGPVGVWAEGDAKSDQPVPTTGEDQLSGLSLTLRPAAEEPVAGEHGEVAGNLAFTNAVPSLSVETTGPDTMIVGRPAPYTVRLANPGRVAAHNVAVRISLPSWVEPGRTSAKLGKVRRQNRTPEGVDLVWEPVGVDLVWEIDEVPSGAAHALTLDLVPRKGRPFELLVDCSIRPSSSQAEIQIKEPKLSLELSGTEDLVFGQQGKWVITLTNSGTATATGVSLDVFAGDKRAGTVEIGSIPAGNRRAVDLALQPGKVGTMPLRAEAKGDLGLHAAAKHAFLTRRANLAVYLQGPVFQYAGSTTAYKVLVLNTGDAVAENVSVNLSLPDNTRYLGGIDGLDATPTGLRWRIDRLEAGQQIEHEVRCELRTGGEQQVAVQATTPDELVADDAIMTQVQIAADLELKVLDPKGPQSVAETVDYEIQVTNRGTDVARQVYIVAVCDPELEPIEATGKAAIQSGQIFFRPIDAIRPGGHITHKVTLRARKDGSHLFRVVVGCDDPDTRLAREDTTRFFVPPANPVRFARQRGPSLR